MKYRMFYNQGKYGKLRHIKIMGGLPMDKEEVVSKNFIEKIKAIQAEGVKLWRKNR